MRTFSAQQERAVDRLRVFFGEQAAALYEANDRSLHKLIGYARSSTLPACRKLAAGLDLALQAMQEELRALPVLSAPQAVADYLKLHFAGQQHESFVVLFLNAQHAAIAIEDLFRGTLTQTSVYPREIVKRALQHNAAAAILAHNHPSGAAEPSRADEYLTQTVKSALALVDVRVLDHFVVSGASAVSFAQRGLL